MGADPHEPVERVRRPVLERHPDGHAVNLGFSPLLLGHVMLPGR
jgi:hypothetical protein